MSWPGARSRTLVAGSLLVVAALAAACASTGGVPRPFPTPGSQGGQASTGAPGSRGAALDGSTVAGTALTLRGAPYRDGGSDPSGFDCSGFTQWVFARHRLSLPREVREQFQHGTSVPPDDLEPGDLLFFTTVAPGPSHVGIAVGAGQFVHAPSSRGVVRVERLSTRYWSRRFLGARRFVNEN